MTDSPTARRHRRRAAYGSARLRVGQRPVDRELRRVAAELLPGGRRAGVPGEKGAVSAQKLGHLQPFAAVFPQECAGQLASLGPT